MERSDIDIFLRAKRQMRNERRIFIVCLPVVGVWTVLWFVGINNSYLNGAAGVCFVATLFTQPWMGPFFGSMFVTRSRLLDIIERQINHDPKALEYISDNDT